MGSASGSLMVWGFLNTPSTPVFIVQMRSGGKAGHTDEGNDLSLGDMLTRAQPRGEPRQMPVHRGDAPGVVQFHQVAVAAAAPREQYAAIAGGAHRRADRGGVVDALVARMVFRMGCSRCRLNGELTRVNSRGARRKALWRLRPAVSSSLHCRKDRHNAPPDIPCPG